MDFENLLVRCKVLSGSVWDYKESIIKQDYVWEEGYIAPVSVSDKGVHFSLYTGELKDYAFILGVKFAGSVRRYDNILSKTIGRYTGLKDKNGTKVFEGDILAFQQLDGKVVNCGVVKYGAFNCSCCDGVYGYYLSNGDIRYFDDPDAIPYVVIGNKWDNPELLEDNND